MGRYEEIRKGLLEAIAYERGELTQGVAVHKVSISSVKNFSPDEIKRVRLNAKMTQSVFATCVGVSKKSVEAWEGGRSRPDGAARRIIGLMESNPKFADDCGIIIRK